MHKFHGKHSNTITYLLEICSPMREQLIREVANDSSYRTTCLKIAGGTSFGDDLYSEMIITLGEITNKKSLHIKRNGYLRYWWARTAWSLFNRSQKKVLSDLPRILTKDIRDQRVNRHRRANTGTKRSWPDGYYRARTVV